MDQLKRKTTKFFLLSPNREKIIISGIISIIILIIFMTIPSFGIQSVFLGKEISNQIFIIVISFFFSFIVYYPLTCGLVYIYKIAIGKEKTQVKYFVIAIIFIVIFNPVSFGIIFSNINVLKNKQASPPFETTEINNETQDKLCGLQIEEITAPSAMSAGLSVGEVIQSINDYPVGDMNALIHALANNKPNDTVTVITNANSHNVILFASPQNPQQTLMGVKLKQIPCGK